MVEGNIVSVPYMHDDGTQRYTTTCHSKGAKKKAHDQNIIIGRSLKKDIV